MVSYLDTKLDMSNYRGDLGDHLIVGKMKISRKIILPDVHGIDGVPESFTVNRCPLACISHQSGVTSAV
jgi:hypothetical protein